MEPINILQDIFSSVIDLSFLFDEVFGLEDHRHNHVRTYSLIVTIFFVLTSVIAMILFPGYSVTNDFLSTLGTHRAKYPFIFNIATIITAILLVPTYLALNRILARNLPPQS